jgi:hypothetical protein
MDITGGTWIQKHFWWNKIRALVWNGKITGYDERKKVIVTWDPCGSDPNQDRTIVTATNDPNSYSNFITVRKDGQGDYTTIQAALGDASLTACGVIEVQDDGIFTENLTFPNDVNYLTLQAGSGNNPTIRVTGADINTVYIGMMAVGQTIQGFNIDFSGSAYPTDNNSVMILSDGGASTVRDCTITGPTSGWIRGITNVATIEDTEISSCREGIICDLNEVEAGFSYSISGCYIHDTRYRGIAFLDCNAVMDDCLVERCGGSISTPGGNVLAADGNSSDPDGTLKLLITNSTIRKATWGRNFNMESIGTVTIEDSIIMNALKDTIGDEILQYRGTLNLNRCIIKAGQRACVNVYIPQTGASGGICNIDHCDLMDTNNTDQWAAFTYDPCAVLTVTNSILTGPYGLYAGGGGTVISNWNDNFCDSNFAAGGTATGGPNDIDPAVYPFYIQTDDANLDTFFALQPYSPLVNADEDGNHMGSQGPMTGYEDWPGDFDDDGDVDFNDFAILGLHWGEDTTLYPGPNVPQDDFESYSATGAPGQIGTLLGPREVNAQDSWRELTAWGYTDWLKGKSTLSLLTDANDANSGVKAMRWIYNVNVPPNDVNAVRYTEILTVLPNEVNFAAYNELRLILKRHAGNTLDGETFMYTKFLNNIYDNCPGYTGSDKTGPDKFDWANTIIGGNTAGTHPDEYYRWRISLDNLGDWQYGHSDLHCVGAIIFGIQSQPVKPYGYGKGTIDVDDIWLIDVPDCEPPPPPVGDLHPPGDLNCKVTLEDVKFFTDYWLEGK